ncbi:MAG TPA: Asp-tRNA(Asn)/Glu-tRNA(Gln) amidotransferase subunit GatA [Alphaproteobacteria bacterium]|nr:Asp-tRNA(Asn)/Glu-tRNA(Gln) amidotransferase subunit GatA [Alphaproteobacteria bacterium]
MTSLTKLTLNGAKKLLNEKKISAVELTQEHLIAIEKHKHLNAYTTVVEEKALNQAKEADERYKKGEQRGLEGLPLGIKELFCTKDIASTASSKFLKNFVPPYESTVTQNLLDQGAVFLGKLNMDEFAMGSGNLTSCDGPVINPWKEKDNPNKHLVPGGSSGGSSAAVAAHLALAATASDTGGSIRQPASFTGTVGLKPTYGLCSRFGMIAFASSLDQAGPIAKTVEDAATMLRYMASFDPKDSTSINATIPAYDEKLTPEARGLRIGISKDYYEHLTGDMAKWFEQGISWLKESGAEIVEVSLKTTPYGLPAYYIVAPAEASSNLARYDGVRFTHRVEGTTLDELYENSRTYGFGDEVKRRILIGTYVLSQGHYDAYYTQAQKVRTLILKDFEAAFNNVDLILAPTTPTEAFGIDEKPTDPVTMYLNDVFTVTANLAGIPGISIPCGLSSKGLPLGLQLLGPRFSEQRLLNVARTLEICANFKPLTME